ncbi:LOW QUALITY PROTEIN: coiled-coil domain-containing protein 65-like, partial [Orussus abietinus]|uniref:LOW QUALITY PROTEIN: coiled-coil domain-containing protein 65-like n=1 Tax=Orussus abietinus TaxID=222816 RepID=UPI000625C551
FPEKKLRTRENCILFRQKLSPEEKRARATAKREAALRAKREREIFLKKEHLKREVALSAANLKKIRGKWRETMRKVTLPSFKEDLEVAWRTFDRALDIKDYSISLLMDAVSAAEEQYQMNFRSHVDGIDRLMGIFGKRLHQEQRNYRRDLEEMLAGSELENTEISNVHTEDETVLQAMIFAVEHRNEEFLNNVKSGTITKVDAMDGENKEVQRLTGTQMEKQLGTLCEHLQKILTAYLTKTADKRKLYEALRTKDEKERGIIERQMARTISLYESIRKFREKIGTFRTSADKEVQEIAKERDFFQAAYWAAKDKFASGEIRFLCKIKKNSLMWSKENLISDQEKDKSQLKVMTIEYKRTTGHLEQLVNKAEQILTMVQMCRKFETLDEKILPFVNPTELEESVTITSIRSDWDDSHQILEEFQNLEQFWRRVSAAQLITSELRVKRDKLKKETHCLQECLRHCISVRAGNAETLSEKEKLGNIRNSSVHKMQSLSIEDF